MTRTTSRGPVFRDRSEAGRDLAEVLLHRQWSNPLVLGLARGGIPVATEIAARLGAALDVVVARKIGAPGRPELGVGAITADGPATYDDTLLARLGLSRQQLFDICEREQAEARRREAVYHDDRDPAPRAGRDVILVDDGLATGATATAALHSLREQRPATITLAVPVCSSQAAAAIHDEADEVICLSQPHDFQSVGQWYGDFTQTSDEEVLAALRKSAG
jgi:putative phosphoribosyl transferase